MVDKSLQEAQEWEQRVVKPVAPPSYPQRRNSARHLSCALIGLRERSKTEVLALSTNQIAAFPKRNSGIVPFAGLVMGWEFERRKAGGAEPV